MSVHLHMQRTVASMLLVLASAGTALADDPPAHVAPFLGEGAENVRVATGAFGPAKETTLVVSWNMMGRGSFESFALVPDARARDGYRKLAVPRFPTPATDGESQVALTANLDKDPADEVVLALHVMKSVQSKLGGYTYSAWEYVVLDWDGKQLVRLPVLEKKLEARMKARQENTADLLTDGDLRGALGLGRK
jgi:hypothetical protein